MDTPNIIGSGEEIIEINKQSTKKTVYPLTMLANKNADEIPKDVDLTQKEVT